MAAGLIVRLVGAWVPHHRDRHVYARGRLLELYSLHPARLTAAVVGRSVGAR
jgi:hypothetical protein